MLQNMERTLKSQTPPTLQPTLTKAMEEHKEAVTDIYGVKQAQQAQKHGCQATAGGQKRKREESATPLPLPLPPVLALCGKNPADPCQPGARSCSCVPVYGCCRDPLRKACSGRCELVALRTELDVPNAQRHRISAGSQQRHHETAQRRNPSVGQSSGAQILGAVNSGLPGTTPGP